MREIAILERRMSKSTPYYSDPETKEKWKSRSKIKDNERKGMEKLENCSH